MIDEEVLNKFPFRCIHRSAAAERCPKPFTKANENSCVDRSATAERSTQSIKQSQDINNQSNRYGKVVLTILQ